MFCACPAFSRAFFLTTAIVQVTWLPEVTEGHLTHSVFPWGAHAQPKVAQYPPCGMACACASGSCAISAHVWPFDGGDVIIHMTSPGSWGCYLGRPRSMLSMAIGTNPFTGYLPLLFS